MRKATRVCLRMYESEGLALPAIVVVCVLALLLETWSFWIGSGSTVRPYDWTLNFWLFLALGTAYAVWSLLRARGMVDGSAGQWFVLAAIGVWMRVWWFNVMFGWTETFGDRAFTEEHAPDSVQPLILAHRYGGLLAFGLGLAMVALSSRRISVRAGRAGTSPATATSGRGRGARSTRPDARPS